MRRRRGPIGGKISKILLYVIRAFLNRTSRYSFVVIKMSDDYIYQSIGNDYQILDGLPMDPALHLLIAQCRLFKLIFAHIGGDVDLRAHLAVDLNYYGD